MKISKGTIVRTIMLIIVVINLILKQTGHEVLNISENEVLSAVEMIIELAVIIISFWKNNSYSQNALKADELLKNLNEMEKINPEEFLTEVKENEIKIQDEELEEKEGEE